MLQFLNLTVTLCCLVAPHSSSSSEESEERGGHGKHKPTGKDWDHNKESEEKDSKER